MTCYLCFTNKTETVQGERHLLAPNHTWEQCLKNIYCFWLLKSVSLPTKAGISSGDVFARMCVLSRFSCVQLFAVSYTRTLGFGVWSIPLFRILGKIQGPSNAWISDQTCTGGLH